MVRLKLYSTLFLCCLAFEVGCRRAAPPSFSTGAEVDELTEDIEDQEELELYQGLQKEIAVTLRELTGTATHPILLGTDETTDQLKQGFRLYTKYCVQCHGVNGDGKWGRCRAPESQATQLHYGDL